MPWEIQRIDHAIDVRITPPMDGQWLALMDELQANLNPIPKWAYVPSRLHGGTPHDADMLRRTWRSLTDLGIVIQPPRNDAGSTTSVKEEQSAHGP
jgi:hypothetical protein